MRDRREVLKLLAGGTAAAAGASLITSSTAFADGGTVGFRPTCPTTAATVTWTTVTVNNQLTFVVAPPTISCTSGWTASVAIILRVSAGFQARQSAATGTLLATGGAAYSAAIPRTVTFGVPTPLIFVVGTSGASATTDIADQSLITVDVIVRRTCTNNAQPTRRSFCCTRFSATNTFNRQDGVLAVDLWPIDGLGDLGAGATNVAAADGCTAP
jgi:hypothetical protein